MFPLDDLSPSYNGIKLKISIIILLINMYKKLKLKHYDNNKWSGMMRPPRTKRIHNRKGAFVCTFKDDNHI